MPVEAIAPSPQVLATYQASLDDYFGPHAPEVQLFHLPVGILSLEQLATGATLADVVASGCRFFAAWPNGNVTSCEMTNPTIYGTADFRNIVQGDPARIPFRRILESHGLDETQTASFALHFLSIPGVHFEGVHLVHQGDGSDLVLPVLSWDLDIATDAVLGEDAFLALVRPFAAARAALASADPLSS